MDELNARIEKMNIEEEEEEKFIRRETYDVTANNVAGEWHKLQSDFHRLRSRYYKLKKRTADLAAYGGLIDAAITRDIQSRVRDIARNPHSKIYFRCEKKRCIGFVAESDLKCESCGTVYCGDCHQYDHSLDALSSAEECKRYKLYTDSFKGDGFLK